MFVERTSFTQNTRSPFWNVAAGCVLLGSGNTSSGAGVLRIALTGFDKSKHDEVLPKILERLDFIMSLGPDDEIVTTFKQYNPFYASTGKSSKTVMG